MVQTGLALFWLGFSVWLGFFGFGLVFFLFGLFFFLFGSVRFDFQMNRYFKYNNFDFLSSTCVEKHPKVLSLHLQHFFVVCFTFGFLIVSLLNSSPIYSFSKARF